jgi:hypothetical protein
MTNSNDSSTEQTTSPPHVTFTLTPPSGGLSSLVNPDKSDGWNSTPESETGTSGLRIRLTETELSSINSDIESYISTALIPYLLKQSPGDLNLLSQKYVLEVRSSSDVAWDGSNFYYKFTIQLCSKSRPDDGEKHLLSISLSDILKTLSLTLTP